MTINWERESGERIEEFAAAYILLSAGRGNQMRPSQGDRGIDVQVPSTEGWDIYQIKRFATNLNSSAKRQIKESWERFRDEVLPSRKVKSWSLVMPLEPTPQNEIWLDELTRNSGIEIRWVGRATLDGWAASDPRLADYFFGDGGRRLQELMALAFSGAQPIPGEHGEPLLASIQDRMRSLNQALDEVDPFYRYELEVRTGNLRELHPLSGHDELSRPGLVESVLEQLDERQYLATHIIARSEVSTELRPVQGTLNFRAETPEEKEALERWFHYGAPLAEASATITRSAGPPGTTSAPGTVAAAWTIAPVDSDQLPPLEARLLNEHDEVVAAVPVTRTRSSSGVRGDGRWLRAELGPAAVIEYFVGAAHRQDSITLTTDRAVGASPDAVRPVIELIAKLPGNRLELAVRNGPVFMPGWTISANDISAAAVDYARLLEALEIVQQHSYARVTIPDAPEANPSEILELFRLSTLLSGGVITGTFAPYEIPGEEDFFLGWDSSERSLVIERPIIVRLAGAVWDTDMNERQELDSVSLDRSGQALVLRPGRTNTLRSVGVPRRQTEMHPADDG